MFEYNGAMETVVGARATMKELEEVQHTFGLSQSELADLFDRRPQSIREWHARGIPQDQQATAGRLLDLARLFRKKIKLQRIPQIIRTPDEWLNQRSILDVLRTEGVGPVYSYLGRLFSYIGA